MALVTSSFALFVLVKAIGVLFIVNIYKRIRAQSEMAAKIGQTVIIMMVLVVVGNNLIQIASATTSFGFPAPYEFISPGRVEPDGTQSYLAIGHNMYNVTMYFPFTSNASVDGGLSYNAQNVFFSNNQVRLAVIDWAHPYRMFLVFSNLDVAYTDSFNVIYEDGYYAANVWPIPGCSNCNDLHKIGVLTSLNTKMSGFVDSNGDLVVANGLSVIKFIRSSDYAKITYLTLTNTEIPASTVSGSAPTKYEVISDLAIDSNGNLHVLAGGYANDAGGGGGHYFRTYLSHTVYSGTTKIYNLVLNTSYNNDEGYISQTMYSDMVLQSGTNNKTTDIAYSYRDKNVVRLKAYTSGNYSDICIDFCGTISANNGMEVYSGYAYISSASENKIYRFPTTISVSSGSGYVPGIGVESTDQPDIIYDTKSINSMYASYYNTSKFVIQSHIKFESGYYAYPPTVNYGIVNEAYRWQYRLIDPNGVSVKTWDSSACDYGDTTFEKYCELSTKEDLTAPSTGWQSGSWYVKLYEHKIDTTLFGDAPKGNLALLSTSAAWTVLNQNESANSTGTIGNPEESLDSPDNLQTISQIDGYVGLLGFGVNSVSKFLFALIFAIVLFVIGMYYGKSGMIGLALSSFPYVFFAFIGYIPKWVFIIYVILLIVISKVFR
jgi:hypothetical protein